MIDNHKIYHQRLKTLEEKFWEKVDVAGDDACWNWNATKRNGYGRMFDGARIVSAHRLSWRLRFGDYPPEDKKVLHKCDNPSCVNPLHLFLGTQQDNVDDMTRKGRGRGPRGTQCHNASLTEEDVVKIRKLISNGESHISIAGKFNVTRSTISAIKRGASWSWL